MPGRLFSRRRDTAANGTATAKEVEVEVVDDGKTERERLDAEWQSLKQAKAEFEDAQQKANRLIRQERAQLQIEWEHLHREKEELAAQREQLNEAGLSGLSGLDRDRNSLVQALRKGKEKQKAKEQGRERSDSQRLRMRFSMRRSNDDSGSSEGVARPGAQSRGRAACGAVASDCSPGSAAAREGDS